MSHEIVIFNNASIVHVVAVGRSGFHIEASGGSPDQVRKLMKMAAKQEDVELTIFGEDKHGKTLGVHVDLINGMVSVYEGVEIPDPA
jgi:hypothetical protein